MPGRMPWFTRYVEKLTKGVNVFFHERTAAPGKGNKLPRKRGSCEMSAAAAGRARCRLDVTCCTGRRITGPDARIATSSSTSSSSLASSNFTEEDFMSAPTIAYPKAQEGALYSFLLVDLKGHYGLHAKSHRLSWVQHNIPGAAFARGDLSACTVCKPYHPPCCRRGSLHVLALVFEQRREVSEVSPMFADDCRLSQWLTKYGAFTSRMVVCEELQVHVQRSSMDSTDSDSCSRSSGELELPTVSFHRLESPTKLSKAHRQFVFPERPERSGKGRPLDALDHSPLGSPKDSPKRMKVF